VGARPHLRPRQRLSEKLERRYRRQVKSGQTLADIETPDLDQQLLQAKAELATARSNLTLASSTAKRWQGLLAADAVSHQEADEKAGDLAAKQSAVNAMQANVDRVQALQRYTRLVAPFDGVVTARNTDVGALINVGGAGQRAVRGVRHQPPARVRQRAAAPGGRHQGRRQGRAERA
jgi:multidrug efflux pump subunit AcrA (membrane-fusion protein)